MQHHLPASQSWRNLFPHRSLLLHTEDLRYSLSGLLRQDLFPLRSGFPAGYHRKSWPSPPSGNVRPRGPVQYWIHFPVRCQPDGFHPLVPHRKILLLPLLLAPPFLPALPGFPGHLPGLWSGGRGLPPVRHRRFPVPDRHWIRLFLLPLVSP